VLEIEIYNKHDLTFEDYNEIIKLEEEIRLPTINSNIVEERNFTFINAVCKIYITFSLFFKPQFSYNQRIYK